jgi:predicted Fe-S protein YdhL (DUF1289 family)
MGCFRTGEEIGRWRAATNAERKTIIAATQYRRGGTFLPLLLPGKAVA